MRVKLMDQRGHHRVRPNGPHDDSPGTKAPGLRRIIIFPASQRDARAATGQPISPSPSAPSRLSDLSDLSHPKRSACANPPKGLASGIKKRSFSLLLARRYLNPRRSLLSSFTLISLIGVMLGVLVLVVVMAVYAGLERMQKSRLLGFTPHILLRYDAQATATGEAPMQDWQDAAKRALTLPRVQAATAYVADNVILDATAADSGSAQRPVMFRSIDTSDQAQVDGITRMLDLEKFPDSTADMGIDDRAVVSSIIAEQFGLRVGDTIRLYSTRNFEEVMRAYKTTEKPPLREAYAEVWKKSTDDLTAGWRPDGDQFKIAGAILADSYNPLLDLTHERLRDPERDL